MLISVILTSVSAKVVRKEEADAVASEVSAAKRSEAREIRVAEVEVERERNRKREEAKQLMPLERHLAEMQEVTATAEAKQQGLQKLLEQRTKDQRNESFTHLKPIQDLKIAQFDNSFTCFLNFVCVMIYHPPRHFVQFGTPTFTKCLCPPNTWGNRALRIV